MTDDLRTNGQRADEAPAGDDRPLAFRLEWATVAQAWRGTGAMAELARVVERTRLRCDGLAAALVPLGRPVERGPRALTLTIRITADWRGDHGFASVEAWAGPDHARADIVSGEWPCKFGGEPGSGGAIDMCLALARAEAMRWLDGFAGRGWVPLPETAALVPFTGQAG